MNAPKTLARIAGLLYLMVTVAGIFAEFFVNPRIVRSGDAAATAEHIRASATLFRVGIVSHLVATTCWLLTAVTLYLLLKHVNQLAAAAMVTFVAIGTAIGCLSVLHQETALRIATGDDYPRAFGRTGSDALILLSTNTGGTINALFFGLWLLPLGYLVIRSGYFPTVLGVVLVIGGLCWIADFTQFLAPGLAQGIGQFVFAPAVLAELVFMVWLLAGPVRIPAETHSREFVTHG